MDCKQCLRNGIRHEGGSLGICHRHKKNKCLICNSASDGQDLCITCQKEYEEKRMDFEVNHSFLSDDDNEIRRERLLQAKFYAHRAIELYFKGMAITAEAIWGDITKFKKAA